MYDYFAGYLTSTHYIYLAHLEIEQSQEVQTFNPSDVKCRRTLIWRIHALRGVKPLETNSSDLLVPEIGEYLVFWALMVIVEENLEEKFICTT